MSERPCSWCGRRTVLREVEIVVSLEHQARWWATWTCTSCVDAFRDLLDDAATKRNQGSKQLGWWEDKTLYDVDGVWTLEYARGRRNQEPPAAS